MSLFVQIFMVLIHFFVQLLLYLNFCCCHIAVSDLYHMYHMCRCGLGSRGALQLWAWRACGIGELGSCRVVEFWIRGRWLRQASAHVRAQEGGHNDLAAHATPPKQAAAADQRVTCNRVAGL